MLSVLQHQYIATCTRCPRRTQRGQHLVCTIDGRTIFEHAEAEACADAPSRYARPERVVMPDGAATQEPADPDAELLRKELEGTPERYLGDKLESFFKLVGAERAAKAYEKLTGRPCGCAGRKAWLNKVDQAWRARWGG